MRILQGPASHYTDISQKYIKQTLQGKWHQLKPRTFIGKADSKFVAVAFNCLERVASAFLKIIQIDYYKQLLGVKHFQIINPPKLEIPPAIQPGAAKPHTPPGQKPAKKPADYDLDKAIDQVRLQAAEIARMNKKLCLFLCRGSQQSVPQNPDEVWVSLDYDYGRAYKAPSDPKRIHLQMDINDQQRLSKIARLFDKVILDQASFNAVSSEQPWQYLGWLLKKSPEAELITETFRHCAPTFYRVEEDMRRQSNQPNFTTREVFTNERQAFVTFPIVSTWDAARNEAARREAFEAAVLKTQKYLQRLFTSVELKRQQPFPCQQRLVDHFVMKGPK